MKDILEFSTITVVYIGAGLANRMFQYAFALNLREKGFNVFIDEHSFKPRFDFEDTKLSNIFDNIEILESPREKFRFVFNQNNIAKIYRKISNYFPDYKYIEEWQLIYDPNIYNKITRNCILSGFWISYKYFENCENEVKNAFKFKEFTNIKNLKIKEIIVQENSVAVHFRKNIDYMKNKVDVICSVDYYVKAIEYMKENVYNPKFYFFSDNWDWVRENIHDIDYIAVNWNSISGHDSHCDMQLMSYCKHNIIANSTYSWWSAWLNTNPDKIIISPNKWFPEMENTNSFIIPPSWIKI